jgi:Zn-finger nucleic acid-binding protein
MDRGELEKVLGAVREDIEDRGPSRKPPERETDAFRRPPEDGVRRYSDDDGRRRQGWDDDRIPRKKRGFDIFDIFD